jgi:hypothetical protein
MFTVTEAEAAGIRTAFEQGGELWAAVELSRLFFAYSSRHLFLIHFAIMASRQLHR